MAVNGLVLSVERIEGPNGEKYPVAKVDQGGGATVNAVLTATPNVDSLPLPGDVATVEQTKRTGTPNITGTVDPRNTPMAQAGEFRVTGRVVDGETTRATNEVYLKADGTVVIQSFDAEGVAVATFEVKPDGSVKASNAEGSIELAADGASAITTPAGANTFNADGSVSFSNGAQIDATGDVVSATGISLSFHTHTGNLGAPTGPPLP